MALTDSIDQWDGKSAKDITAVYNRYYREPDFAPHCIKLLAEPHRQKAASWLLKHHLETGHSLSTAQLNQVCKALDALHDWESQLHLLQLLAGQRFSAPQRQALEPFVRQCLTATHKFVRAWAYNLLHELAQQFPDLAKDARDIIAATERDEAPSVKARLRQLQR
ncbi:hypothetical protein [Gilvimarinus algae]|uniref:HEAT repeat domain-containing protein n=1 Tax=Gilvimarinus algae TaxID=3058037 RepID=A0ABT8TAI8_9GAMM|nr:hypothetical protein [Gilvimarinus sp. SDUM040014]MDO3380961.1 hypothetical protein [Gilvimarinus sp. SDUM040014]